MKVTDQCFGRVVFFRNVVHIVSSCSAGSPVLTLAPALRGASANLSTQLTRHIANGMLSFPGTTWDPSLGCAHCILP